MVKLGGWLLMFISTLSFAAADYEREKRLEDQIIEVIFDGEPVYLETDTRKFLSVYMETEQEQKKGAVIILHGRGYHADWRDVVQPLRVGLPEHGWDTLSLQLPVLHKQAKYYDYVPLFPEAHPRIEAAIRFLHDKGINNIVLVAHSCGAHMAMSWVDATGGKGIDAYVGIGMGATDYKQKMAKPFPLDKLEVPVLDLYGERDYPAVLRMAPERMSQVRSGGNPLSQQVKVPDANHYFTDMGEPLLDEIAKWLDTLDKR
jgi:pimeloyl-ACP methyl ester carboxylesterase